MVVRTTPPTLATLDLQQAALRSVADAPAQLLPSQGAVAPAAWTADGTLVFAAPRAMDSASAAPAPGSVPATPQPAPFSVLQVLAPGRIELRPLCTPAVGPGGMCLLALTSEADATLQVETLDLRGHLVAKQALGMRTTGPVSVRWDLPHAQLVLLQAAAAGGIDARVLRLDRSGAAGHGG